MPKLPGPPSVTAAVQPAPSIGSLGSWFGSNCLLAPHVGRFLRGCNHVSIPFGGGMCELTEITARTVIVGDLHRHIINLAAVVKTQCAALQTLLRAVPAFHPDVLNAAQAACLARESAVAAWRPNAIDAGEALLWARDYFVCCWMARSSQAGTDKEFGSPLSVRWDAGGGDSVVRFRNAVESLEVWERIAARCSFVCMDFFEFIENVKDAVNHGIYCDPPFPGPGDKYRHKFGEPELRRMAARLDRFRNATIVIRFYDHPLVREMYPTQTWRWHRLGGGRTQANNTPPEVLITRRAS